MLGGRSGRGSERLFTHGRRQCGAWPRRTVKSIDRKTTPVWEQPMFFGNREDSGLLFLFISVRRRSCEGEMWRTYFGWHQRHSRWEKNRRKYGRKKKDRQKVLVFFSCFLDFLMVAQREDDPNKQNTKKLAFLLNANQLYQRRNKELEIPGSPLKARHLNAVASNSLLDCNR